MKDGPVHGDMSREINVEIQGNSEDLILSRAFLGACSQASSVQLCNFLSKLHGEQVDQTSGRGGGALPYISYIGMYRPKGYGF